MTRTSLFKSLAGAAVFGALALSAQAGAIRNVSWTNGTFNTLAANDDGSTGLVNIGFSLDFFGNTYNQLYVNNNGNVTFDSSMSTFTPYGISGSTTPIIAPFFGDVDTRASDSSQVTYGTGTIDGYNVFAVDWVHVGVFAQLPIYNSFQLLLVDQGNNNFTIEFNYDTINWETGQASSGNSNGLGGYSAHVGYSNGAGTSYEFTGSGVNGFFTDFTESNGALTSTLNSTGLIYGSSGTAFDNVTAAGRYDISVTNGIPDPIPSAVPEPSTYGLMGAAGLLGLGFLRRRASRKA